MNLPVYIKFSPFAINNLYFKLIFNSVSGNFDPLFSQINFDHTLWGKRLSSGIGGFCPGWSLTSV